MPQYQQGRLVLENSGKPLKFQALVGDQKKPRCIVDISHMFSHCIDQGLKILNWNLHWQG